jgi:hypothetical protein
MGAAALLWILLGVDKPYYFFCWLYFSDDLEKKRCSHATQRLFDV